jgi:hypothetical protein
MQMPHVVHDLFGGTFLRGSSHLQLDSTQISHSHNTGVEMAPDLAVRSMLDGARPHQIVGLAETKPVLNLAAGKTCLDDIEELG